MSNRFFSFTITSLLVLFINVHTHAQRPYIVVKISDALAGAGQKISEDRFYQQNREFTQGIYGSFGKAWVLQAGIGKMINPTFGFEVTTEYNLGKTKKTGINDGAGLTGVHKDKMNSIIVKPVIVIRNSGDLLSVYSKLGIAIACYSSRRGEAEVRIQPGTGQSDIFQYSYKEKAKVKMGFTAAFGIAFRVSPAISLFGEINGQMMAIPIHRGGYTKFLHNGQDLLKDMDTREKEWEYVKSGFLDENNNPNQPSKRLYSPANYSSVGLAAGILFHL